MRSRRRDERGAVAILTAVCLVLVVTSAAFAVDLGMQRVVRSDVQALADAVALDAARLLDGRNAGQIRAGSGGQPALAAAVAASAARNDGTVLGDVEDVTGTLVYLDPGPNGEWTARRAGGVLVNVPDSAVPDAVLVEAAGGVDFAFATGRGRASRDAVATASPFACFRLGSYAAALDSGNSSVATMFRSLVGDALGVSITAVGYQGLLDSYIGLEDLAVKLNVGSAEALATLDNLQVKNLLSAGARVLTSQGDSAAAAQLDALSAAVGSGVTIDLGDILSVGDGAAAKGSINAVDLLGSAAFAAVSNGAHLVDTGVAWSGLAGSAGNVRATVVSPPKQACGEPQSATAETAQVELSQTLAVNLADSVKFPSSTVSLPVSVQTGAGGIGVSARLAKAAGTLASLDCGAGTAADPEQIGVDVTTQAASAFVTLPVSVTATNLDVTSLTVVPNAILKTILGVTTLPTLTSVSISATFKTTLRADASAPGAAPAAPTQYAVPPHDYTDVQPSATGSTLSLPSVSVGTWSDVDVTVTVKPLVGSPKTEVVSSSTLDLSGLTSALAASATATGLASVVTSMNGALASLQQLLGLHAPGADLIGVPRPSCSSPSLVG